MDKDTEIGIVLKSWAGQPKPPGNGRARLIWEAARLKKQPSTRYEYIQHTPSAWRATRRADDWKCSLFHWVAEQSFHSGFPVRVQ
jgi:hypothetical protein